MNLYFYARTPVGSDTTSADFPQSIEQIRHPTDRCGPQEMTLSLSSYFAFGAVHGWLSLRRTDKMFDLT